MARYVDIEKAEYPYMSMSMFGINSKDCRIYNEGVKATEDMIQALPTADVQEVVYCKDCEYNENGVCIHPDNITHSYDSDDNVYDYYISVWSGHFCSYGKRKND